MNQLLDDVTVLDLSRVLAGPWATQLLADYGARVIKIEKPVGGDDTRHWGPPNLPGENADQLSAYFLSTNRGKQSVAIDVSTSEGQQIVKALVKQADVLVENFKVGNLARYGLDYDSLVKENASLIYCSITGFGQTGPNAHRAGYDAMIQAMGGLMSITGESDDKAGGGPQKVGVAVADLMTGMYASTAILAALHKRSQTGKGEYIDLALFDSQVAWLANQNMNYLVGGEVPKRRGTAHPNIVPYQSLKTADGFLMLAVGNDSQFAAFCEVIERHDLAQDPYYATNSARVKHRDALLAIIEPILSQHSTEHWLTSLEKVGVPCGPIQTLEQVLNSEQVQSRSLTYELRHPIYGPVPQVDNPVKFRQAKQSDALPPPMLGEHTDAVLSEWGWDREAIAALRQRQILF